MSEFRFAHPIALVFGIIAFVIILWQHWRVRPPTMRYSDNRLIHSLALGWKARFHRVPDIIRILVWILLVIGLARPQSGSAREILRGEGIDMVMALDISGSMSLQDFEPNRFEAAKSVIRNFVKGRSFDRIGLVVFASDAFYQSPPTLDYDIFLRLLDEVRLAPELGLGQETALGIGIASAANMLRDSTSPSRIIIVLTDGANNTGEIDPITAAQAAHTLGIKIYTISIGQRDIIRYVDENNEVQLIKSDLDEETLQNIADIGEGAHFQATDLTDLQRIYEQINQLERTTVERQAFTRWQDQAWVWLIMGLTLLIIERILRVTVFQTVV